MGPYYLSKHRMAAAKSLTLSRQFQSQKTTTTIMLIFPTRFPSFLLFHFLLSPSLPPWSSKEGRRWKWRKIHVRSSVWRKERKKKKWSEKPLSLSIRRSPFIEEGTTRTSTTRNVARTENQGGGEEESHSLDRCSVREKREPLCWSIGVPVAPPPPPLQEAYVVGAVANDDTAAAAADNNNAWETAECEKKAQGVPSFSMPPISVRKSKNHRHRRE